MTTLPSALFGLLTDYVIDHKIWMHLSGGDGHALMTPRYYDPLAILVSGTTVFAGAPLSSHFETRTYCC
jgi:hypothetical protein